MSNYGARFLGALMAMVWTLQAHAQIAVFDGANFGQNVLIAARALQQIQNQIQQLNNEAVMLVNEARNLTTLPFNIVGQLRQTLQSTTRLITQAPGLSYNLAGAQNQFVNAYPAGYAANAPQANMLNDATLRGINSWLALYTTVSMQAQAAQNLTDDENALATLVQQSQGAIGALQASQATNQLLALQSRQMIQDQQLRVTQDRTVALEQSRTIAEEARAREVRRRFLGQGTRYTAAPIGGFGF